MRKLYCNSVSLNKTNIFFLIRSLNIGGTERQLIELVKGLDSNHFDITVGLFYNEGALIEEIKSMPWIHVVSLNKSGRWDIIRFVLRFIKLLKSLQPDILYSFLPDANIAGLIAGRLSGVKRVVWGVRASNMDVSRYDWLARMSLRLSAFLSKFPDAITNRGRKHIELLGKMAEGGVTTMVLFVVQRHDAKLFQPQWKRDPKFGHALYNAWKKGLGVRVIHMKMTLENIHYLGEIPFELNPQS